MSLDQLRQKCVAPPTLRRRDLSVVIGMLALPLLSGRAKAGAAREPVGAWVGETGMASFYSNRYQGRRTAFGTRFDQRELIAAHPWLPYGARVRVASVATGASVIVTVADRLYARHCVIDLSLAAACRLGMTRHGLMQVTLTPA